MLSWFLRLESLLTRLALVIAVVMLIISVSLGFFQVLTRFIFNAPSTWSEVIARAAMIWCVFMGAAATFRGGYMMAVELIYKLMPRRTLLALELAIGACCLLVLGVLMVYGVQMTLRVRSQMLSGLGMSIAWAYAAIPTGSAFAMVAVIARLLAQSMGLEKLGPENSEVAPEAENDAVREARSSLAPSEPTPPAEGGDRS
ncbi:TRAP transporter small permease [Halomonas korlensis]|uniref:TRAP transporter small permease protein n=1 Tax=Halomonas korlensis TaxID=463301 RepID=A0A1I7IHL0_9GAMM|nr:TRAP transporter small permease [Halomonas korlensis]SFU72407.1 TRAP-type C4-dicarboxylate transport system, small permease component [Halomonas korlensis]